MWTRVTLGPFDAHRPRQVAAALENRVAGQAGEAGELRKEIGIAEEYLKEARNRIAVLTAELSGAKAETLGARTVAEAGAQQWQHQNQQHAQLADVVAANADVVLMLREAHGGLTKSNAGAAQCVPFVFCS